MPRTGVKEDLSTEICLGNALEHFFLSWFPPEKAGSHRMKRLPGHSNFAYIDRRNKEYLQRIFIWICKDDHFAKWEVQMLWSEIDDERFGYKKSFAKFMEHLEHIRVLPAEMKSRWKELQDG